jgi:hypothetical protein
LLDGCEEGVDIEMENRGLASHGSHSAASAATGQTSPVVVTTMFGFGHCSRNRRSQRRGLWTLLARTTLATQL